MLLKGIFDLVGQEYGFLIAKFQRRKAQVYIQVSNPVPQTRTLPSMWASRITYLE
jgi:hypothetical protein